MTAPITDITRHLTALVAVDSQNPPRAITTDGPLVAACRAGLPGFDINVVDYGQGSIVIDAKRGAPRVLFNVHMDTVPVAEGWSRNPHDLLVTEDRAIGLGSCDIKGAAAVLFALAASTDAPMHLVLSTDEEAGQSTCIRRYLENPPDVDLAVVAEPTSVKPILQHRGISSNRLTFVGSSAHSSETGVKSAIHDAARWTVAVLDHPEATPNRLNVGRVEGGVKPNMIAASAEVLFGFRHAPGTDHNELLAAFDHLLPEGAERHPRFLGPALPSDSDGKSATAQTGAAKIIQEFGFELGEPVDFWTEASLFSAAGVPATVMGPGHIAQAHTADEWVPLADLAAAFTAYERIVTHG